MIEYISFLKKRLIGARRTISNLIAVTIKRAIIIIIELTITVGNVNWAIATSVLATIANTDIATAAAKYVSSM